MNPGKREGVPHFNFDFWLILLVGFCSLALHLLYRRRKTQFKVFRALFEPKKDGPSAGRIPRLLSLARTQQQGRGGLARWLGFWLSSLRHARQKGGGGSEGQPGQKKVESRGNRAKGQGGEGEGRRTATGGVGRSREEGRGPDGAEGDGSSTMLSISFNSLCWSFVVFRRTSSVVRPFEGR